MWLIIVKLYSKIYAFFHFRFNFNLKGMGVLLDRVKKDQIFIFNQNKHYFNPKTARSYGLLVADIANEPETHLFVNRILDRIDFGITFIDVGASIGEFVIDMASKDNVNKVVGFEPNYEAFKALKVSVIINDLVNVEVINKALCKECGEVLFFHNKYSPMGSNILEDSVSGEKETFDKIAVIATTLDEEFATSKGKSVVLIDVEGAELEVVKGGKKFIANNRPLIIFEYND